MRTLHVHDDKRHADVENALDEHEDVGRPVLKAACIDGVEPMHGRRHRAEDLEEYQRHREGEQQLAREAFAFHRKRVGIQEKRIGLQDEHGKVELIEENRHKAGDGPIKGTRAIRCDVERSAEHADDQIEDKADTEQRALSEARAVGHGNDAREHQ